MDTKAWTLIIAGVIASIIILIKFRNFTPEESEMALVTMGAVAIVIILVTTIFG